MSTARILKAGQMLYEWLSQFAATYRGILPAGQTPDDIYLRFDGYVDNFSSQFVFPVYIYAHNTSSYASVVTLADTVGEVVGEHGILLGDDDMRIRVHRGSPFYQDKADEDENVRAGYINLLITIY